MPDIFFPGHAKPEEISYNLNSFNMNESKKQRNLRSKLKCYLAKSQTKRMSNRGAGLKSKELFPKKLVDPKKGNFGFFKKIQARN